MLEMRGTMHFKELSLGGAFLIEPDLREDERGFFARTWCRQEFAAHGIQCDWVQSNISFNKRRGTLRGLHYQAAPWEETKLVRCTMGAIYDVLVDLRPASPRYGRWEAVELTARNRCLLYVPDGFAHGFQTLVDNSEVFYQMSQVHWPDAARGIRWDDSSFDIGWPACPERIISRIDLHYPDFVTCAKS
jgi:dTDP-4-dehydrorhamnose 3,5-epimerase